VIPQRTKKERKSLLKLKQVREALVHLAREITRESVTLNKERGGNTEIFREVLYLTLANEKEQKLYVGQLLFVTADENAGEEMHKEMMTYLDFQSYVLGQGKVCKSCLESDWKGE
jgi:hypothetical protein